MKIKSGDKDINAYRGSRGIELNLSLTSTPNGGMRSTSLPATFTLGEKSPIPTE